MISYKGLKRLLTKAYSLWVNGITNESGTFEPVSIYAAYDAMKHLENCYLYLLDMITDSSLPLLSEYAESIAPIRAKYFPWGISISTIPMFDRENNNCYYAKALIQDIMAKKWRYNAETQHFYRSERYAMVITHNTIYSPLSAPPNPIEAHSIVNGLAATFGTNDYPEAMDFYLLNRHKKNEGFEGCNLSLISTDFPEIISEHLNGDIPLGNAVFRKSKGISDLRLMIDSLPTDNVDFDVADMPPESKLRLLSTLNDFIISFRLNIPYSAYESHPPKRVFYNRGGGLAHQKMLENNPVMVHVNNKIPTITVTTNAYFINRENLGSWLLADKMCSQIASCAGAKGLMKNSKCIVRMSCNAKLCRKSLDGDNFPINDLCARLKSTLEIEQITGYYFENSPNSKHHIQLTISCENTNTGTPCKK